MKIKYLILAVLLVTITSCTKNKYNLTVADKAYLNKTVDSIFDLDQNVRLHFNTIDKKNTTLIRIRSLKLKILKDGI